MTDQQAKAGGEAKKQNILLRGITSPVTVMIREAKATGGFVKWNLQSIAGMLKFNRDLAKKDIEAANTDPERFWDDIVISAGVTEKSLRSRYKLATAGCCAMILCIGASIGMLIGTLGVMAMTIGNLVLLNVLVMIYIVNVHRLYTAREQRLITVPAFLKLAIKKPALLIPHPLPKDYSLRKPMPAAGVPQ